MRKVIIFVLFTFLFIPLKTIKAINNYELPMNKNIRINSINEKYKWYKLKEVDSRNENVFEHSCEYLEQKETEFTEWSKEKPEEKYGRIIEEKEVSNEQTEKIKFSKITISNIYSPSLHIKELKLYDDNSNELKYSYAICSNCFNQKDLKNLNDNDYSTTFEIKYESAIYIFLDEETDANVRAHIYYEHKDSLYGWRIEAVNALTNETLYKKDENLNTLVKIYSPAYESYINSKTLSWYNDDYSKYYRYKDTYFICHEKEYLNGYYENMDDYIKDDKSLIKYYDYEEIEPNIIEKEVFKEIIVPKEKTVNKYISVEKNSKEKKEVISKDNKTCKYVIKKEESNNKKGKISKKVYVVFVLFLSLIVVLCLFLKELIKKCR